MGRVQLFEISLSHGRVVYSPGEPLAGTVRVRLGAPLPFRAIRVTCTGSCGVSNKANDTAWVVEEGYFNSSLSLADKGKFGSQFPSGDPCGQPLEWGLSVLLSSPFPRSASWIWHWPILSQGCEP
ncbi:ARRDC1 isoform 12 [Pongo abelii]|uniref:ARRDC1 isoform 12 n=1 Tax=Pongo abelii TaxID=9601 RepID=A0A2J8RMB3_PONAB|nr:ARRDC1 isoform 12 [Pongo abelii]